MGARQLVLRQRLFWLCLACPAALFACPEPREHWENYLRADLLFRPAYLQTDCPLPAGLELPLTERFAAASRAEKRALVEKRIFLLPEAIPTLISLYYDEIDLRQRMVHNLSLLASVARKDELFLVFRRHLRAKDPALEHALLGVARLNATEALPVLGELTKHSLSAAEYAALLFALTVFRDPAGLQIAEAGLAQADLEWKRQSESYLLHLASRESTIILERAYYEGLLKQVVKSRAAMLVRNQSLHETADRASRITSAQREGSVLDILNLSNPNYCQKLDCRWAQVMDYYGQIGWAPLESLVFLPGTGE